MAVFCSLRTHRRGKKCTAGRSRSHNLGQLPRYRMPLSDFTAGIARPKNIETLSSWQGFLVYGGRMRPKQSKQQQRKTMQQLMERRERKTPERKSPEWMQQFWANRRVMA